MYGTLSVTIVQVENRMKTRKQFLIAGLKSGLYTGFTAATLIEEEPFETAVQEPGS
jgi:hypothetical protein